MENSSEVTQASVWLTHLIRKMSRNRTARNLNRTRDPKLTILTSTIAIASRMRIHCPKTLPTNIHLPSGREVNCGGIA